MILSEERMKWLRAVNEGKAVVFSNTPYSMLFDQVQRNMNVDLAAEILSIDDYRRIGRTLNAIGDYLDHNRSSKEVLN